MKDVEIIPRKHFEDEFDDVELIESSLLGNNRDRENDILVGQCQSRDENNARLVRPEIHRRHNIVSTFSTNVVTSAVIVLGVLALGVVELWPKMVPVRTSSSPSPSPSPLYSMESLHSSPFGQILPESTQEQVQVEGSPQAQAFAWTLKHPEYPTMPDWRKLQLMSLSTIYFATGGDAAWRYGTTVNGGGGSSCPAGLEVFWQNYKVHECSWSPRNRCSAEKKISHLVLGHVCGLTGSIPQEINFLTALTSLVVEQARNNNLGGSLPAQFGQLLSGLQTLNLSESQITGPPAEELGQLTRLESLSHHPLGFGLPTELGKLTNLEDLQVSHISRIKASTIPSELGLLTKLTNLQAKSMFLEGPIPPQIMSSNMAELRTLRLSRNMLTGSIPTTLAAMSSLAEVSLQHNLLTGSVIPDVCLLSTLQTLQVDCNLVTCSCCECT